MILAGDVGGTKINLAVFDPDRPRLEPIRERRVASDEVGGFEAALEAFLAEVGGDVRAAAFGVAGPVVDGRAELTNLGWTIDAASVARRCGLGRVDLLNDLVATAYGLDELPDDRLAPLQEGRPRGSTAALVAAGTGLGGAVLYRIDGRPVALPSEIGHADFAARDDEDIALLRHLRAEHGRVSVEQVVSGPGLWAIYRFLRDTGRAAEPVELAERLSVADDPSAIVSSAALEGGPPICVAALERFVAAYGAVAGNLALGALALAGVYVAGGIAPSILPALRSGPFLEAFRAKGRLAGLVAEIPVTVVLEPRAALLGAARFAVRRAD